MSTSPGQLLSQTGVAAALDDADGAPTMTLDGLEAGGV